jgi:hypothetical protein
MLLVCEKNQDDFEQRLEMKWAKVVFSFGKLMWRYAAGQTKKNQSS